MTAQSDVTSPGRTTWLPEGFQATGPPLGVGATAIVWPARRTLDGRELALKVWRRPFADAAERDRFRREIRRQAALNEVTGHVATYSWAEEDPSEGTPWIGTVRHGSSLAQLLERDGSPLPDGYALCADLLAGLAATHELGLVHRDVKPANVIASGGRAQLCDFGLVLDEFGHTTDSAAGTPRYLAPELAFGARPSACTDVFSAARTIRDVLGPGLPAPLERLLAAAGSPLAEDRPAHAGILADAFRAACAGVGQALPPPLPGRSGADQGRPPVARPRHATGSARGTRLLAAAALILAAAAAVLALVVPRSGTAPPAATSPVLSATATAVASDTPPSRPSSRTPAPRSPAPTGRPGSTRRPSPAATVPPPAATTRLPVPAYRPDAGDAEPDIAADGSPVVLPARPAAQCAQLVAGMRLVEETPYRVGGTTVALLRVYTAAGRACAKLVKPAGSPYAGVTTHLALTLCGDSGVCEGDWHAYPVDAGPVTVPAQDGCVSTRVSLTDTSDRWVVRGQVRTVGCP